MVNSIAEKKGVTFIKQIELRSVEIKLRSDGIMQFDLKPCDDFSINDLKEVNAAADALGEEGKAYPRLTFVKYFLNMGQELRAYAASEESNRTTVAAAFVTNVLALKFVGNFYISFNKPVRPTRLFDSEEKAVEWLKSFMQV